MPKASIETQTSRKIIHVDMDCFYAAIEMRDDPLLRKAAVAVGGSPDKRGVIATCNYEARSYGVHSAMASAHAKRLCPNLIIVPPNFDKYRHDSKVIRSIFSKYTPLIEPLSLDEAYLDVSDSEHYKGSATYIAQAIRHEIHKELNLTASAGIAPNKFLAKVASDWEKPNGQFVITPDEVDAFMLELPVKKIPGVGKKTSEKLHNMGVYNCADLQKLELLDLTRKFGSFGQNLYYLARGIDNRPVITHYPRKSLSVENTYDRDLYTLEDCQDQLPRLMETLKHRLARSNIDSPVNKLFVKVKFSDFSATTVEKTSFGVNDDLFYELMDEGFHRREKSVRLLGIGVRFQNTESANFVQLPLEYIDEAFDQE
ncbi:DNA polymerase IV [Kangiella sediminilitoris]|uniref:DNA polymerase IV n=1 Tax=Kangiella sediminilitoris TaxID=1144748 RepID=A0A1B3BAS3_9GAMM|nr:DNA polymerase IV [Kangiella sediminilitoris]AOE49903.1 DNA polymerase IV [Kangiella sediminilitoris]